MKILSLEKKATTIPPALDSGLRLPKVVVCAMLLLWEHGIKKKTDTSICYNNRAGTAQINACGDSRLRGR